MLEGTDGLQLEGMATGRNGLRTALLCSFAVGVWVNGRHYAFLAYSSSQLKVCPLYHGYLLAPADNHGLRGCIWTCTCVPLCCV